MHTPTTFGFDHLAAMSARPVLVVYGERSWRNAVASPLNHRYAIVSLPAPADTDDTNLAAIAEQLAHRAVVILPEPADEDAARAERHAQAIAAHAAAVGIVDMCTDGPAFDLDHAIEAALDDAHRLALPCAGRPEGPRTRAVAPLLDPVDGTQLFARLRALLDGALGESETARDAIALWCVHAWALDLFDVSPRLILAATDPRSAHARALRVVGWLTPKPELVSRTIAPHLLPLIKLGPTLLLDDVGGTMLGYLDMRALIIAGASRDGAFLGARTKGNRDGWSSCFAATAIATTARVPDDLGARAIVVPMAPPRFAHAGVQLSLSDPPAEVRSLRAALHNWAADVVLPETAPDFSASLAPGARERWPPLLEIADALGGEAPAAARAAARALAENARPAASDLELLADIRELAGNVECGTRIATVDLLTKLVADPERAWATANRGRKLTPRALADRLARFDVHPRTLRLADGAVQRGYQGGDLLDAFARYL
jgi:hypothetical protein